MMKKQRKNPYKEHEAAIHVKVKGKRKGSKQDRRHRFKCGKLQSVVMKLVTILYGNKLIWSNSRSVRMEARL